MHQPYPPQQPPRPPYRPPYDPAAVAAAKRRRGRILAAVLVPIAAIFAISVIVSVSNGDDDKPAAKPTIPAYEIVDRDDTGNARSVTVEVKTDKHLRAVFDDVAAKLTEPAGYTVLINCSTGGTKDYEHRLVNGRKAIGKIGAVVTGLDDGQTAFEPVEDRHCPA